MSNETLQNIDISRFQQDLLTWYDHNKRILPWRKDKDPYKVWVSEVMLQQTRVDTVIPYFDRFMKNYPTIYHLAEAEEQEVLKMWEGLGYYSRARNLHEAVREVVASYDGVVPRDAKKLGRLKGIGPYTQGAIMSIAFNEPEPAVDGNVMRVLSRVLFVTDDITEYQTRKRFETFARQLISDDSPGDFNQALMELGALICKPKNPICEDCPLQSYCKAKKENIQEELPVKTRPKKQRTIPYVALLIQNKAGEFLIEQRPSEGLLANMWQFPMVPITEIGYEHISSWFLAEYGIEIELSDNITNIKHVFSHLIWKVDVFMAKTEDDFAETERAKFVPKQYLEEYPFPVPHLKMKEFIK
ncbi:MAG TPA: A/G-specific adenine glycosylase [Bacillota bacterium]|nr:A/G-specific adenine glycosylase [Bacillota bacterium]